MFINISLHCTFYINRVIFSRFRWIFNNEFKLTISNFIILYPRTLISFYHFHLIFIYFSLFPPSIFHIFIFKLIHKHFISNSHNLRSPFKLKFSLYSFTIVFPLLILWILSMHLHTCLGLFLKV